MSDAESDKSKDSEKSALNAAGREMSLEATCLDSQSDLGTLAHVQSMELLANQDSPSELNLKCPDLSVAEREHIQNNRLEIVGTANDCQDNFDSVTLMAVNAESIPAVMPVALLRQYADSLPVGHPDKIRLTDLSRQQAAILSPEFANRYDRGDGSIILDIGVTKSNLPPQDWFDAAQRISELSIDKQFEVIGTALSAGYRQYSFEERERKWGQIIGTVQGVSDVLQFYATISDFAYDVTTNNEERLQKRGGEFGEALGKTIVGGVKLFNLSYDYSYNIGYTGEYYKPFRDVVSLANAIDMKWKLLPLREQERIKAELVINLLADGVITAGGAKAMSHLPKFTQILDNVADETKMLSASIKDVSNKAADRIVAALDDITKLPPGSGALRPAYGYLTNGGVLDVLPTGQESSKGWKEKIGDYLLAMGNPEKDKSGALKSGSKRAADWEDIQMAEQRRPLEDFIDGVDRSFKNITKQIENGCVYACGEMLSEGALKQEILFERYKKTLDPQILLDNPFPMGDAKWLGLQLGPEWIGGTYRGHLSPESRFEAIISLNKSWAAEFKQVGEQAHLLVVDGLDKDGMVLIRDPERGAYKMNKTSFFRFWNGRGVVYAAGEI